LSGLLGFAPMLAFAQEVRFGRWDLRGPEGWELDLFQTLSPAVSANCRFLLQPSKLAAATVAVGARCGDSQFSWEAVPQIGWDSLERTPVVPALRLGAISNFEFGSRSKGVLFFSYKIAPESKLRSEAVRPGFQAGALRRWMDVLDSHVGVAWMFTAEGGDSGWLFWFSQTVPQDVRLGGIEQSAALQVKLLGGEWRKQFGNAGFGLGVIAVDAIFDDVRVLFPLPALSLSYEVK
jgi:hypothetical protein